MSVRLNYFMIFIAVAAEFVVQLVIIPTSKNVVSSFVNNASLVSTTDSKVCAIFNETIFIVIYYALMRQLKYFL